MKDQVNIKQRYLTQVSIKHDNFSLKFIIKRFFGQKFDLSIDLLIKDRILPAELLISKISQMKLQTDIRHRETSEIFKMFTSRHNARQNKSTNPNIINKNEVE